MIDVQSNEVVPYVAAALSVLLFLSLSVALASSSPSPCFSVWCFVSVLVFDTCHVFFLLWNNAFGSRKKRERNGNRERAASVTNYSNSNK